MIGCRSILSLLFIICSIIFCLGQAQIYRCPPCASDCHKVSYEKPGSCPVCGMELVTTIESQYEGYQKTMVAIQNDSIELNAAYYSPVNSEKTKGALIIVHGSAPTSYQDVSYYTRLGTTLGMAVLAFDKRGVGDSTGTYEYFTVEGSNTWFNLLASDVLACVYWLRDRPELHNSKIGLLGGSQAGWIMPLAAAQTNAIDFMIIGEGAAVSAGEEHYFSQWTGDGDESGLSIPEAHERLKYFDGEMGFDPRRILEKTKVKTLWIFGTKDPVIPVDASLEFLNSIDNPNFEIEILPDGDHNFNNTRTGERYDLIEFIEPWLTSIQTIKE